MTKMDYSQRRKKKPEETAPGRYVVGERCIACMLCSEVAPGNLGVDAETGMPYVRRQPGTADEEGLLRELMYLCPTGAITDDEMNRIRRGL